MIIALALAATVAVAAPGESPQVQSNQSPLIIDRNRIDRPQAPEAPRSAAPRPATPAVTAEAANVTISGIRFIGSQAPAPVAEAGRPFIGKHADKATLQALAAALSAAYAKADVALYTVAIPGQDFRGGTVIVRLTEATIAQAGVKGANPKAHPLMRARLTRMMREKPLSRRTFERQLTLMRSIPGATIDPQMTDPHGTGALTLVVTPKQRHSKFTAGYNNRGSSLLGEGQFDARGELYSVLENGDQFTVAASASQDFKRYRYVSTGYAIPVGSDGLTFSANAAYLATRPKGTTVTGDARQAGIALTWPFLRDFHHAGDVSVAIDGINSDNAVFGNVFASERTRAGRVSAGYSSAKDKLSLSLSGSLSQGIDMLGARTNPLSADTGFTKAVAGVGIGRAIGKRAAIRLNATGQYGWGLLPAAERYVVGGESVGRAFEIGVLTGDKGAGGSIELGWRPIRNARFQTTEFYGFVDGAVVGVRPRGPYLGANYSLASAGVGTRLRYRTKAEVGLEASHAIDDPYRGYPDQWRVAVAWRLSL